MVDQNEVEGILQVGNERSDGQLRDPAQLLRPLRGGVIVSKQMISEMRLRPGLMLKGQTKGRHLSRINAIERRPPDEWTDNADLYHPSPIDPHPTIKLDHHPE